MPRLKVKLVDNNHVFTTDLERRCRELLAADKQAQKDAAATATTVSRDNFHYRRDIAPLRAGRSTTGGQLRQTIRWRPLASGGVGLNVSELDAKAPHWIIQEIGTGQRATIRVDDRKNPVGRPAAGATYVRTVKSQRGRHIASSLVFATKGGVYSPPPGTGREQLYLARAVRSVTGGPVFMIRGMRIRREIKGQHFIRKGGREGFRQYKQETLAAARRAFYKRGSRA